MTDKHPITPIPTYVSNDLNDSSNIVTPSNPFPVIATRPHDDHVCDTLNLADTAFNFFGPVADMQFVITGAIITAREDVHAINPADIVIYEASSAVSTVVDETLIRVFLTRNQYIVLLPLSILVTQGVWINAKTDDDDVHITITGNYIPEIV